jgi:chromosomal replication initiator protein
LFIFVERKIEHIYYVNSLKTSYLNNTIVGNMMMSKITKDFKSVWDNCLAIIKDNIDEQSFSTWFEPILPVGIEKSTLIIQVPSQFFYEWLEEHYVNILRKVIRKELGPSGKLQYKVVIEKLEDTRNNKTINLPSNNRPAVSNPPSKIPIDVYNSPNKEIPDPFILPGLKKHKIPSNLVDTLNFDNYVEGDCNRLARTAGWAVSKNPGKTAFNPLFIYSEVGLGKTHSSCYWVANKS